MKVSARNRFSGNVKHLVKGPVQMAADASAPDCGVAAARCPANANQKRLMEKTLSPVPT